MTKRRRRFSDLSLNQKLVLLMSLLGIIAMLIASFFSGHDWFAQLTGTGETEYIGRVIDIVSQQPVSGAKVTLDLAGVPPIVYTDNQGIYLFKLSIDRAISGRVRVDAAGYEVYIQTIRISPEVKTIEDIRLTPVLVSQDDNPSLELLPNTPVASSSEEAVENSATDGMEMVPVPAGEFRMGDPLGENDEKPGHLVYLEAFSIDKTEVTLEMFANFVYGTGYQTTAERNGYGYIQDKGHWQTINRANWLDPDGDGFANDLDLPVTQVSWTDAAAYCEWAGRRLPTEAEWEKAARGMDGRIYPWGNTPPDNSLVRFNENNGPSKVGSYPNGASPYGALDLSGNVWEWTADWYSPDYYASSPSTNPKGPSSGDHHVLRGGGWNNGANVVRVTNRDVSEPQYYNNTLGFRCAK